MNAQIDRVNVAAAAVVKAWNANTKTLTRPARWTSGHQTFGQSIIDLDNTLQSIPPHRRTQHDDERVAAVLRAASAAVAEWDAFVGTDAEDAHMEPSRVRSRVVELGAALRAIPAHRGLDVR